MTGAPGQPLLQLQRLTVTYRNRGRAVTAVDGVNLDVPLGGTMALIGESGSGKTSLARAVCGLQSSSGNIVYGGTLVRARDFRGRMHPIQMVHQDPYAALNPRWPIWRSVAESIRARSPRVTREDATATARRLLLRVGLSTELHDRLPHRVSGGQCQRVAIARAIGTGSKLLVLDEAVSALDAAVKRGILDLLRTIATDDGVSYLFVTHDMATVASFATEVAVMRGGVIVERGECATVLANPHDAYTRELLSAVPTLTV